MARKSLFSTIKAYLHFGCKKEKVWLKLVDLNSKAMVISVKDDVVAKEYFLIKIFNWNKSKIIIILY